VGAAGGAITGSMSKKVPMGKGAALGGALGALAGGAYGAYQGDQQYQTALWSCMRQLGTFKQTTLILLCQIYLIDFYR
jgi:hypothetical protein